jgi:hypothetical protein
MRLAASLASVAVALLAVSTWSTAAHADDVASPGPPLAPPNTVAEPVTEAEPVAPADVTPPDDPTAIAPPPPAYEAPVPRETSHWYGGQILIVDGASLGGGLAAGLADPGTGSVLFLGGYVLGGPIVHLAHRRPLAALGSLVLRVGAPTLGALTGYSLVRVSGGSNNDNLGNVAGAGVLGGVGLIFGYATAIALDSAVLAHEDVPLHPDHPDLPDSAPGFTWTPSVAPVRDGAVAGIVGRF